MSNRQTQPNIASRFLPGEQTRVYTLTLAALVVAWWAVTAARLYPSLLLPAPASVWRALANNERLPAQSWQTLRLILMGVGVSIVGGLALATASFLDRRARGMVFVVSGLAHPLPGIAILPLALLWFGTGEAPVLLVTIHAALWALALSADSGFRSVNRDLIETAQVYGYQGLGLVALILLPCALPAVLAGVRIAWARAWRAAIAAEMVFGASGNGGGLGWLIFEKRYFLDTAGVFAALMVIMAVGVVVELLFTWFEKITVKAWGVTL